MVLALGYASGSRAQLAEAENAATWVLMIFSPALLLAILTVALVIVGILCWSGRLSARVFVWFLIGAVFIFGARTIAPQIASAFGGGGF
jgi:type IV secretory pathway VirB2 component (pilin)